ncbi:unnamed protein product [Paramecium octaurelia]|uniref:Transmembrane protein n=1 Tax=Paramecium octaurelia TaxID=43137 RepID=A0A8S1UEK6_PAROT|nr:unnamed protein product [Paramecium octaurelia]
MWILLSSIIFSRIFEYIFKTQVKNFFYMKQVRIFFIIKLFLFLLMLATFLFGIYFYLMIQNQTSLIISYDFAILIDLLFLDMILFIAIKFWIREEKINQNKLRDFNLQRRPRTSVNFEIIQKYIQDLYHHLIFDLLIKFIRYLIEVIYQQYQQKLNSLFIFQPRRQKLRREAAMKVTVEKRILIT